MICCMAEKRPIKRGSRPAADMSRTSFDMPRELHARVRIHGFRTGQKLGDLFNRWIAEGLQRDEQTGGGTGKRRT